MIYIFMFLHFLVFAFSSKKYSFDSWIFIFLSTTVHSSYTLFLTHTYNGYTCTHRYTHLPLKPGLFFFYVAFSYLPNLCWFLSQLLSYSWHLPNAKHNMDQLGGQNIDYSYFQILPPPLSSLIRVNKYLTILCQNGEYRMHFADSRDCTWKHLPLQLVFHSLAVMMC